MLVMTRTALPQRTQVATSMLNTRFSRRAQLIAACRSMTDCSGWAFPFPFLRPLPGRHHLRTPAMVRREDTVVTGQVHTRARHQGSPSGHEIEGFEDNLHGAVPVGCLEQVHELAVCVHRVPLLGHRGARDVAAFNFAGKRTWPPIWCKGKGEEFLARLSETLTQEFVPPSHKDVFAFVQRAQHAENEQEVVISVPINAAEIAKTTPFVLTDYTRMLKKFGVRAAG